MKISSFMNQTTAVTVRAYASAGSAGPNSAGSTLLPFTAELCFAEVLRTVLTRLASLPCPLVPQLRSPRQSRGLNSLVSQLFRGVIGNTGNDSIYLGDQLTTFGNAFVGGGAGDDLVGTFNSQQIPQVS